MLHTNFHGNRSTGSGEDFRRVFNIQVYGRGGHLGHVNNIILIHFHFIVPLSSHSKMAQLFLRKASLSFVNDLQPRSSNSLDIENSNRRLHLPTFRTQTAIVSVKSIVFTFFL